ncbi:MAG: ectonucleotide pyrophosphatase/phosphodiesterase [Sphingomonas sp.]
MIDAPKHMARGEFSYDDGRFFGRAALSYMSKRYLHLSQRPLGRRPRHRRCRARLPLRRRGALRDPAERQQHLRRAIYRHDKLGRHRQQRRSPDAARRRAAPGVRDAQGGVLIVRAMLFLAAALCATPAAAEPVLLISIDGLRPADVIEAEQRGLKIPNLRRFVTEGAYATGVRGVLPTVTYPSHVTLITGASPARHGVFSNTTFDPGQINAGGWYWYAEDIKLPTLWSAAAAAGKSVGNVHWPVSVGAAGITWNLPQVWRTGQGAGDARAGRRAGAGGRRSLCPGDRRKHRGRRESRSLRGRADRTAQARLRDRLPDRARP